MSKSLIVLSLFTGTAIICSAFFSPKVDGFKNLQVLPKNISEHNLDSIMHLYSVSLGTDCGFCHAIAGKDMDFASDANKVKLRAREMMRMTDSLNHMYFPEGQGTTQSVTCYSCHHGQKFPDRMPADKAAKPAWLQ